MLKGDVEAELVTLAESKAQTVTNGCGFDLRVTLGVFTNF
jgi:outer membrane lipopolysaccharide assembly protein LptE/RlpB